MGLVKSARKYPPQGVPLQAPEAHGHSQHEEHQCYEERGHFLGRVPQGVPSVSAALSSAGHWTGDLHWEAADNLHQHLLMATWTWLCWRAGDACLS